MADPRGGAPGARPPIQTKIFLISCSFLGKSGKFVCWRLLLKGWRPLLWRILDPPLRSNPHTAMMMLTAITTDVRKLNIAPCKWVKIKRWENAYRVPILEPEPATCNIRIDASLASCRSSKHRTAWLIAGTVVGSRETFQKTKKIMHKDKMCREEYYKLLAYLQRRLPKVHDPLLLPLTLQVLSFIISCYISTDCFCIQIWITV